MSTTRTTSIGIMSVADDGVLELLTVARGLGYERRDLASLFEVLSRLAGDAAAPG